MLLRGWRAAPQVVAPRVAGRNVRSIFTLIVIFLAQPALGSQASVPGCFFCANDLCLLAFSFWRPAELLLCICCIATASAHLLHRSGFCASAAPQRLLCICCIAASFAERQALPLRLPLRSIPPAAPPAGNIFPMALRRSVPAGSPLCRRFPACNSSATVPRPAALPRCSGQQHLPDGSLPQCRNPLRHGTSGQ